MPSRRHRKKLWNNCRRSVAPRAPRLKFPAALRHRLLLASRTICSQLGASIPRCRRQSATTSMGPGDDRRFASPPELKVQFRPKLYLPRCGRRTSNDSRSGRGCASIGQHDWGGNAEIRVVQDIKDFCSQLEIASFSQTCCLEDRNINHGRPWTDQDIASGVSIRSGWRQNESCGVDPLVWPAQINTVQCAAGSKTHAIRC